MIILPKIVRKTEYKPVSRKKPIHSVIPVYRQVLGTSCVAAIKMHAHSKNGAESVRADSGASPKNDCKKIYSVTQC